MSESPEQPEEHEHHWPDELDEAIFEQLETIGAQWNEIVDEVATLRESGACPPPGFLKLLDQQLTALMAALDDPFLNTTITTHLPHFVNLFSFMYELGKRHGKDGTVLVSCDCKD